MESENNIIPNNEIQQKPNPDQIINPTNANPEQSKKEPIINNIQTPHENSNNNNQPQQFSQEKMKDHNQENPKQSEVSNIIKNDNNKVNSLAQASNEAAEVESKTKRHRRGKDEIGDRNYKCPECNKCYLSAPALTNHRKSKHGYGKGDTNKGRGRPRKEALQDDCILELQKLYDEFFLTDERKPFTQETAQEDNKNENQSNEPISNIILTLDKIKTFFQEIYNNYTKDLFQDKYESLDKYPFYQIVCNNWEKTNKEDYIMDKFCYDSIINSPKEKEKINTPPLDGIFFLYLKDISNKTNINYFKFILKFLVTFREFMNEKRKVYIKQSHVTENRKEYTQIYNAETAPDICNDYVVDFMEPKNCFDLEQEELIKLIQHFCFWLNENRFTQSHLTIIK